MADDDAGANANVDAGDWGLRVGHWRATSKGVRGNGA